MNHNKQTQRTKVVLVALVISIALFWQPAIKVEAGLVRRSIDDLPPASDHPLMARYIIHKSDWFSIATISTRNEIKGYPFVSSKSFSDGPVNNSTGVPYLYMTDMDVSGIDILANNSITIMATLAQTNYCTEKTYDPQDPRCPKVMISGTITKMPSGTKEYMFAQKALFERHPVMKYWPPSHGFYIAKVNPVEILLLSGFGGLNSVTVEDYFKANLTTTST